MVRPFSVGHALKDTYKGFVISVHICLCRLRGRLSFAARNVESTFKNIVKGEYEIEGEHWDKISFEAKDLLMSLLEPDPENRVDLK